MLQAVSRFFNFGNFGSFGNYGNSYTNAIDPSPRHWL